MNPLLRFRPDSSTSDENLSDEQMRKSFEECSEASLYWSESEDDTETEARNELEWDSSYHDEFVENRGCKGSENEDEEEMARSENDEVCVVYPDGNTPPLMESRL